MSDNFIKTSATTKRFQTRRQEISSLNSNKDKVFALIILLNSKLDFFSPLDLKIIDRDETDCNNLKPRSAERREFHQTAAHLNDSSCYTIRMTSMPRHHSVISNDPTVSATTTTPVTLSASPAAFTYLLSSTTPVSTTTAASGDIYLLPQSSVSSPNDSVMTKSISKVSLIIKISCLLDLLRLLL